MQPSQISTLQTRAQHDAFRDEAYRQLKANLAWRETLTGSQWADRHFYLSSESSGQEGRWQSLPFQVAWLDVMGADEPRTIDVKKCARVGYTKCLVAIAAYNLEHKRRNVLLYQPTDGAAKKFCKSEIDPMVRDVPCMAALADASENRKRDDTLSAKRLGRKVLNILGGTSAANFRMLTSDVNIYDELDAFDRDIGDEGNPLSLGDRSISNATFPKSIRGSTPAEKTGSLIDAELSHAELVFEYHVRCAECDAMQPMRWAQIRFDEGPKDNDWQRAQTARHACAACGVLWEYREIWPLLTSGQWRSDDRTRDEQKAGAPWRGHRIVTGEHDPVLLDPDGMTTNWPRHIGFQIWSAYSPFFSWAELVFEFLQARGHPPKLKTWTNHRLGETWEDAADSVVDTHDLFERRENYGVPTEVLFVAALLDVQDTRLEVLFLGFGKGQQSWFLGHRALYGGTEDIESPVWKDATDLVRTTTFLRNDGYKLGIDAVGIDSGFRTDTVYRWVISSPHARTLPLKGVAGEGHAIAGSPSRQKTALGHPVDLFPIGVDNAKALVMARLRPDSPAPIHLSTDVTLEQCEQLTAEKRLTRYTRGFAKREWHKIRPRNELLDLYAYGFGVVQILDPAWAALEERRKPKPPVETTPQTPQTPKQPPRNWATDWR